MGGQKDEALEEVTRLCNLADEARARANAGILESERKAVEEKAEAARQVAAAVADRELLRNRVGAGIILGFVIVVALGAVLLFYLQAKQATAKLESDRRAANTAKEELLRFRARNIALRADDALERDGPAKAILIAIEAQKQGLPDLLDAEQGIFKSLHQLREERIISDLPLGVMGLAYSLNGNAIVSMDSNSLSFWNLSDGDLIDTYSLPIEANFGMQWSPTGDWIAIGSRDQTMLLAPCSHTTLRPLFPSCAEKNEDIKQIMGDFVYRAGTAKFSRDGRWMVTGSWGATLRRWDIATAKETSLNVAIPFANAFAISPDMKSVAAGLQNGESE